MHIHMCGYLLTYRSGYTENYKQLCLHDLQNVNVFVFWYKLSRTADTYNTYRRLQNLYPFDNAIYNRFAGCLFVSFFIFHSHKIHYDCFMVL